MRAVRRHIPMRPLTEDESKAVFEKLAKFIGVELRKLVDETSNHVFRLHNDRVYYIPADVARMASTIPRESLLSAGTQFGKFSKTKKFQLHIMALTHLGQYAQNKVWLKPAGEQSFLYGNHVIKRHLERVTEGVDKNSACVIYNRHDVPMGFGVAMKSTGEMKAADPEAVVVVRQADVGEYLRAEEELF